jgi:hypothetical protein
MADVSPRLRPEATALALTMGVIAVHAIVFPIMPINRTAAVMNEGIIWFTALYVLLVLLQGLTELSQRVVRRGRLLSGGVPDAEGRGQ